MFENIFKQNKVDRVTTFSSVPQIIGAVSVASIQVNLRFITR